MADREEEREEEKGFRVVDRRRFTPTGEARTDAEAGSASEPSMPPAAAPGSGAAAKGAPKAEAAEPEAGKRGRDRDARHADRDGGGPSHAEHGSGMAEPRIDFISFVASLATNAMAALGALPEEQARGLPRSPELAREYIDILAMLQEKTRGNLTRDEDQALQQIVTELRLQYVESTRRR